ncbi:glycosyltransferase [Arcobacter sp. F2176]|uniref:glycosyltransferase n=1 Tax=Arcobacter sp. F2176 TaxID=2044511 RepID=UPI00100B4D68|nr:glycosyltransferase [Arcobacter sp. F2176]RXJ82198.1 glucosyltransferase [Arcobacter sp. F2176]
MNILHVISGNLDGGAARGAFWLHTALKELHINSKIITTSTKIIEDTDIIYVSEDNYYRRRLEQIVLDKNYPNRTKQIFSTGLFGFDITKLKEFEKADVIHLHWINDSFIKIEDIKKFKKPIVWTVRDLWPMTGGCHYPMDCKNFFDKCGACPQISSNDQYDLSNKILQLKKDSFNSNIQIVGISNWVTNNAKKSSLFKNFNIKRIFNNVNSKTFLPLNKEISKKELLLPLDKKIILVGAQSLDDVYKGFSKFIKAISYLNRNDYFLCIFGEITTDLLIQINMPHKLFGFVKNSVNLNKLYSASDVFVAPSITEAFGKTIVESMLSGTPAVCFNATGPKDIISHKKDGYKAKPYSPKDLANGIEWVINNTNYNNLCLKTRENAKEKFDSIVISAQYKKLYERIINKKSSAKVIQKRLHTEKNQNNDKIKDLVFDALTTNNYNFSILINSFYLNIEKLNKKPNKKYIIYGNGTIKKIIEALLTNKIVGFIDINDSKDHSKVLSNLIYDKIIISVMGREKEIQNYLTKEIGIHKKKLYIFKI